MNSVYGPMPIKTWSSPNVFIRPFTYIGTSMPKLRYFPLFSVHPKTVCLKLRLSSGRIPIQSLNHMFMNPPGVKPGVKVLTAPGAPFFWKLRKVASVLTPPSKSISGLLPPGVCALAITAIRKPIQMVKIFFISTLSVLYGVCLQSQEQLCLRLLSS